MKLMQRCAVPLVVLLAGWSSAALAADKYDGPRPPQKDMLYLIHADNLIPTETGNAQEERKKDDVINSISGTGSPARTPLAESSFLIETDKISPESLELYRLETKNGRREVVIPQKRRRSGNRPLRLTVNRLERGLYKIEVSETLENGQYAISPSGSNRVFCFEVY